MSSRTGEFDNTIRESVRRTLAEIVRKGGIVLKGIPRTVVIPQLNVPTVVNNLPEENGHRVPQRRRR